MSDLGRGAAVEAGLLWSRRGVVSSFSFEVGIGTVTDDAGDVHPFHCTAIADGTRRIAPGTNVRYVVVPGHGGTFEARDLAPTSRRP